MIPSPPSSRRAAFSLLEIIVVVALIGVITAIAVPAYTNLSDNSRRVTSGDFVESLNRGLRSFTLANWEIQTTPVATSADDELKVIRSLQYPWPAARRKPGSPYFSRGFNPPATSDATQYRLVWNGRNFQVLSPGTNGTGLLLRTSCNDTPYAYPANYKPEGML